MADGHDFSLTVNRALYIDLDSYLATVFEQVMELVLTP